jgi:hypothetical protein
MSVQVSLAFIKAKLNKGPFYSLSLQVSLEVKEV